MTSNTGFRNWLSRQKKLESPVGDLARDASQDRHFPHKVETIERLLDYLNKQGACDGAIAAAHTAWTGWLQEAK